MLSVINHGNGDNGFVMSHKNRNKPHPLQDDKQEINI